MYYVILDSTGNLVESFDSREEALTHLQRLIDSTRMPLTTSPC